MEDLHRRLDLRIRALAEVAKVTLTHLPDRAGVSRTQFWDVLAGRKSPTLRWMEKIAKALHVDVSELLAREAPTRRSKKGDA